MKPNVEAPAVARRDAPSRSGEFVGPPAPERPETSRPSATVKRTPEPKEANPMPPRPGMEKPAGDTLTDRPMDRFVPEKVDGAASPVVLKLHDLDQDAPCRQLADALARDAGFRLELPCDNGTRAFERLQAACQEQKIGLLIEQTAQKRLNTPATKTHYIVYIENMTPEELTRLVQQIGAEDKSTAGKRPVVPYFDRLVVQRLTWRDYNEPVRPARRRRSEDGAVEGRRTGWPGAGCRAAGTGAGLQFGAAAEEVPRDQTLPRIAQAGQAGYGARDHRVAQPLTVRTRLRLRHPGHTLDPRLCLGTRCHRLAKP